MPPEYPRLMKASDSDLIVLFASVNAGMVVSANRYYPVGRWSTTWAMDSFHPFHGAVHLEA